MNNNLINEINNMRSIMGLNSKPVLLESINPTLLKKIWQMFQQKNLKTFYQKFLIYLTMNCLQYYQEYNKKVVDYLMTWQNFCYVSKTDMSGVRKVLKAGGYLQR